MSATVKYKLIDKEGFLECSEWYSDSVAENDASLFEGIFEGHLNGDGYLVLFTGSYISSFELYKFFELVTEDKEEQGYVYDGKERIVVHGEDELIELKSFIKKYVSKRMGERWEPIFNGGVILVYAGSSDYRSYGVRWGYDVTYHHVGGELTVHQFLDKYDPERQVKEEPKEQVTEGSPVNPLGGWSDSHYNHVYKLTDEEKESGEVRLDVYKVSKVWKVGSKDDSGALWHILKTIPRFGEKNTVEREILALHNQVKGLARSFGVELN